MGEQLPNRWWGWGTPRRPQELPSAARELLRERLGVEQPAAPAVDPEAIEVPEPEPLPEAIAAAVGDEQVRTGRIARLRHAAGKSYPDLIRMRDGAPEALADGVVSPANSAELAAVLEACARERVAVIPFGGGTSVVGGVTPLRGEHGRAISLDLGRMRAVEVDPLSLVARLGPGLPGPEAERRLRERGFVLGHYPQSFERATIGGFAATRSAGQASSGYGRFDSLVTAVSMVAPAGRLSTRETPHSAAGPALRELVLGSEGVLGVIDEVAVRVRPVPASRRYEGWMAPSFAEGMQTFRRLAQADALPDVLRLSDESETSVSTAISGIGKAARAAFDTYLKLRRRHHGCLMICGWEGEPERVASRAAATARMLRRDGAIALGGAPGRSWLHGRYRGPYLRDLLIDAGAMVETLETAHSWTRLSELYAAVGGAIGAAMETQGTPGLVLCHVSHVYRDGASLYFTWICAARQGAEIEQWRAIKSAACEAIVGAEGTITHHHAVGTDHSPYMKAEISELGVEALRALKGRLDPAGVMNPGKLLPPG